MNLKDKVNFIIEKYNNGIHTSYSENMIYAIDEFLNGNIEYSILSDSITRIEKVPFQKLNNVITWELAYLLGDCILNNNNIFENVE